MKPSKKGAEETKISFVKRVISFRFLSVILLLLLVLLTIFIWNRSKKDSLSKAKDSLQANAEIYINEIEKRYENIESALNEVVDLSPPNTASEEKDWDTQTEFYINNYVGLEHIVWINRDLIVERVMPKENDKYVTGTKANKENSGDHINLVIPVYNDDKIQGFIIGKIGIPELILSIKYDEKSMYMIQVFEQNGLVTSSKNWVESTSVISTQRNLIYGNKTFILVIKPTKELAGLNKRTSNQILIYGLLISSIISALVLGLQIFRKKTMLLLHAKKDIEAKQTQLEEKNSLLEKQLRDQEKLETIGLLSSGIAHEINNPITGIMNYSQIILDSSGDDGDNAEYAKEIIYETKRVSELVQNILHFSRPGKAMFSFSRPEDIIFRTTSLMKILLKKDQIILQVQVADNLPDIKCNSQQIQQVLMNLMTNARDALNDKFIEYDEDKRIILFCNTVEKDNREHLRITIEDHGNGIPIDVQEKMFKQFYTTKEIGKGTGLGLFISTEIVKEHSGELSFETEEGKLTRFYLDLPIIK